MLIGKLDKKANFKSGQSLRGSYPSRDHNYNPTQYDYISIFFYLHRYQEPPWHLRHDMQYERFSFDTHNQELMIGSVLLGPGAVAQSQAIPLDGLIGRFTWSRAHKSSVGATRKVSPNWSQETMTCHSSNCFSIFGGQGHAHFLSTTNALFA